MFQFFSCNLSSRVDRKLHIENEFSNRSELNLSVLLPISHNIAAISLWLTLQHIIKEKVNWSDDFFIFCEDDHQFTRCYNFDLLTRCIEEARALDSDILSGGVSWFKTRVQIFESTRRYLYHVKIFENNFSSQKYCDEDF